jgi:hypothetical protein
VRACVRPDKIHYDHTILISYDSKPSEVFIIVQNSKFYVCSQKKVIEQLRVVPEYLRHEFISRLTPFDVEFGFFIPPYYRHYYYHIKNIQVIVMIKVPIWHIYSYWIFAMTALWSAGLLPFSPLVSAIAITAGSLVFTTSQYGVTSPVSLFIFFTHTITIWLTRKTSLDYSENLIAFLIYNMVLMASGTNMVEVYSTIFKEPPMTIGDYLCQRNLYC